MVRDTVSRGSNGVSPMPSATLPPALTESEAGAVKVGATGFTVSAMFCNAENPVVPLVAVTVRVAVVTSPAFSLRSPSAAFATVQVFVPALWLTPDGSAAELNVASDGTPLIVTEKLELAPPGALTNVKFFD
jgi:hypothetical protein